MRWLFDAQSSPLNRLLGGSTTSSTCSYLSFQLFTRVLQLLSEVGETTLAQLGILLIPLRQVCYLL